MKLRHTFAYAYLRVRVYPTVPSKTCCDGLHNGQIDPKYKHKTMKRSDQDIETSINTKEPRLEVEEVATCSSSATQESTECDNNSSKSGSVKKALRRSLELKQELKKRQTASQESSLRKITECEERLQEWSQVITSAGYFCEVRSLVSDLSPFSESLVVQETATCEPTLALFIYHSEHLMFDSSTGPFQAVRLIIFPDCEWRLDSPIYEHRVITSGTFKLPASKVFPKEVMDLAKEYLSESHVLCPGLLGVVDLQSELGYIPETVRLINGPVTTIHSKRCKIWHIPARNLKSKADESDPRRQRVCGECLISDRYVSKAIQKKREMESSKRHKRQQPSSNYPMKYLSPKSKTKRYSNARLQRHRLEKHVKKLYKRTKVELPQEQSSELCQLIESIESSDLGKKELAKIYNEGNQFIGDKGQKAGDCLKEVWRKDRESFFKDQRNNGMFKIFVI